MTVMATICSPLMVQKRTLSIVPLAENETLCLSDSECLINVVHPLVTCTRKTDHSQHCDLAEHLELHL